MFASLQAEIVKLRKRPATWILCGVLAATVLIFVYLLGYNQATQSASDPTRVNEIAQARDMLLVHNFVPSTMGIISGAGNAIALILGALVAGSEYGWSTLKTIVTQRPTRLAVLAGKAGGVALFLLLYVVVTFATSLISALALSQVMATPVSFPGALTLLGGLAGGWLILLAWGALGFTLGLLFQGTALAIGLGLIYGLALENLLVVAAGRLSWLGDLPDALLGPNAGAIARYFDHSLPAGGTQIAVGQAVLVLGGYLLVSALLAGAVFRRRDLV